MRIKRLKLYNSKGIWRGSRHELKEIEIDFKVFKSGIIGLYGKSGTGKTTILNNLNPYRTTFKDDFFEDGYRELEFEFKGHDYKSIVYQTKASLFKDDVLLNPSQKISAYDGVLEEELGEEAVFYKLMYAGHDITNILAFTKGQRKDIIVNYLLDYLKEYEDYGAKIKADATADEIKFDVLGNKIGEIEKKSDDVSRLEIDIEDIKEDIVELNNKLLEYKGYQLLYDTKESELTDIRLQLSAYNQDIIHQGKTVTEQERQLIILENKLTKLQQDYETATNNIANAWIPTDTAENVMKNISDIDTIINEKRESQNNLSKLKTELKNQSNDLLKKKSEIARLNISNPPCTSELQVKCPLTKGLDYKYMLSNLEDEAESLKKIVSNIEDEVNNTEEVSIVDELKQKEELNNLLIKINNSGKTEGLKKLADKIKEDAENLIVEIEELETTLDINKVNLLKLEETKKSLDICCKNEYIDYTTQILAIEKDISSKENSITIYQEQINGLKAEIDSVVDMKKELDIIADRMNDYTMLINFFGKSGMIMYDLEMAGEQISNVANKLLENYDSKSVVIRFETLKKNSKGELKEVFDIASSINGDDWQTTLSGGEKILVSNAIREGMSYLRKEREFKTVFLDELDGSLDPEARIAFIKLLLEGNTLNNRDYTLLITHSDDVKAHLEQYISLENNQLKIVS